MTKISYLCIAIENYIEYLENEIEEMKSGTCKKIDPFMFQKNQNIFNILLNTLKNECEEYLSSSELNKMEQEIKKVLEPKIDMELVDSSEFFIDVTKTVLKMVDYIFNREE